MYALLQYVQPFVADMITVAILTEENPPYLVPATKCHGCVKNPAST